MAEANSDRKPRRDCFTLSGILRLFARNWIHPPNIPRCIWWFWRTAGKLAVVVTLRDVFGGREPCSTATFPSLRKR